MAAIERNDVKAILRKREFPFCIRDALAKIEELLCVSAAMTNRQHLMKQSELINELITEFVFNQVDRRGMRKKITRLQELDIVQNISNYMLFDGKNINRSTSNSLYITLFPAQNHERMKMAVTLAAFAISTRNIPVLTATTVLLQQHSYTSSYSYEFVQKVIFELYLILPGNKSTVFELSKTAPIFTANILTRLVEMYRHNDNNSSSLPPVQILNIILNWLEGNNRLCIVPVMSNFQPNVLPSTILITPMTPHIGLIKWCIVAHLENTPNTKLYANLEQLVIESIALCRSTSGLVHNNIIATQDIMSIVGLIVSNGQPERQKRAIESLVKIIRVTLITNTISGSKQDLRRNLQSLPYNEALVVLVEDMAIVP